MFIKHAFALFIVFCALHPDVALANSARSTKTSATQKNAVALTPKWKGKSSYFVKLKSSTTGLVLCHTSPTAFSAQTAIGNFLSFSDQPGCTVYNDVNKTYAVLTQQQIAIWTKVISKEGAARKRGFERVGWKLNPPKLVGEDIISGIHTKIYEVRNVFSMSATDQVGIMKTWYVDEKALNEMPSGAAVIIAGIAKAHKVDRRIPIRETYQEILYTKSGKVVREQKESTLLELISIKSEPFDPKVFQLPKGYKLLQDPVEVMGFAGMDGRRRF